MIDALYVHIPFCHTICPFCAFAVHGNRPGLHEPYLAALLQEARQAALEHEERQAARSHPAEGGLHTVYVGGGTPSTLSLEEVRRLLEGVRSCWPWAAQAEVAFEVNPEDAGPDYLRGLKALGVTRISLGVQSLDDATLRRLGRNHNAAQARAGLEAALQAGVENVNVDLMFGVPEVESGAFLRDVRHMAALRPAHVSLYGLDIEERTLFGRTPAIRDWVGANRDQQAEQYLGAAEALTQAGYRHYEVSNFCLPGREGRQNLAVWRGADYLGLGLGAHSHVPGRRWHNERHLRAYLARIETGAAPVAECETLSAEQRANEYLLLALRQDLGLDIAQWQSRHGCVWDGRRQALCARLASAGQAVVAEGRVRLTARGFLVADEITRQLMVE